MSTSKTLARYKPNLNNLMWTTAVCDGNNNDGLHDQEQFKKAVAMLEHAAHNWRNPRLFHLVMTGSTEVTYKQLLTLLCRKVRRTGALCDYKSAIELDKIKGLHCHVMLVLGNIPGKPERYFTTANETGKVDASLLRLALREVQALHPDLKANVWAPASQNVPYIEFNQSNNERLHNAVEWLSYIYKARSKPKGPCYGSSRSTRRKVSNDTDMGLCLAD